MLDFDSAQALLAARARTPASTESLPLAALHGRILAEDVVAAIDLPRADNSAMDGYALRSSDAALGGILPVQARQYAGDDALQLQAGQAIRLFTGSLIPVGADTVLMQEDTEAVKPDKATGSDRHETVEKIRLLSLPQPGDHIRRRGEDITQGDVVLQRGTRMGPGQIAVLAAQGQAHAQVYPRLRIGILSNGDELIPPGQPLPPAGVYSANGFMLAAMCEGMGTAPAIVRHVADDAQAIQTTLAELAHSCDLVLSVGGASVGDKDLIKPAIEALGGTLDLWRVNMKPGKPVALASLGSTPMVCLPGNPGSAFVVFTLLATPLIRGLQGRRDTLPPVWAGHLQTSRVLGGSRDDFLRVRAQPQTGGLPLLLPHGQQSSGALGSLAWADGLARIPADTEANDGALLSWYRLADWLA